MQSTKAVPVYLLLLLLPFWGPIFLVGYIAAFPETVIFRAMLLSIALGILTGLAQSGVTAFVVFQIEKLSNRAFNDGIAIAILAAETVVTIAQGVILPLYQAGLTHMDPMAEGLPPVLLAILTIAINVLPIVHVVFWLSVTIYAVTKLVQVMAPEHGQLGNYPPQDQAVSNWPAN